MKSVLKLLGLAVLAVAAVVLVLRLFFFDLAIITGDDMLPGLTKDTWVLVSRRAAPARGDLILFTRQEGYAVRRVVGLPGETIATAKGVPVVQGQAAAQDEVRTFTDRGRKYRVMREALAGRTYEVIDDSMRAMSDLQEKPVGDGFFVLADHREHARDSREFGAVSKDRIRGVVILKF